ncbi:type VII toxin-antitoxin system MntA family adenylyltransferase antitoxin [Leptolyngbya sp. NK1-12]|uniref:type VII toxin-antitoxin system MntA family adenylyltransferase antitoxin n=1 Tax=Leptolyngbya sp. NK1-12 TaxID=2547451 RepID=UPI00292DC2EE
MNQHNPLERITNAPNLPHAKLRIRNHRLSVEQILGSLAAGETIESLLEKYPELEAADIQACLLYAQNLVLQAEQHLTVKQPQSLPDLKTAIPQILEQVPYLKLLVLFGSRARGDHRSGSDWDFAFLCDETLRQHYESGGLDAFRIWGVLQQTYHLLDNQIDCIDLQFCSPTLAYAVARDGILLYEQQSGEFTQFRRRAWKTYADTAKFRKLRKRSIELGLQKLSV